MKSLSINLKNLNALSPEEKKVLYALLNQPLKDANEEAKKNTKFEKGTNFVRETRFKAYRTGKNINSHFVTLDSGEEYRIELSHTIICYTSNKPDIDSGNYRFIIKERGNQKRNIKGEGTFGKVIKAFGKITLNHNDQSVELTPTNSLVKSAYYAKSRSLNNLFFLRFEAMINNAFYKKSKSPTFAIKGDEDDFDKTPTLKSYLIMPDIPGEPINKFLINHAHQLNNWHRLQIASAVADSLAQRHQANIIHRDLKTDNVIFNPLKSEANIIDHGLAVPTEESHVEQNHAINDAIYKQNAGALKIVEPTLILAQNQSYSGPIYRASKASDIRALALLIAEILSPDPDVVAQQLAKSTAAPNVTSKIINDINNAPGEASNILNENFGYDFSRILPDENPLIREKFISLLEKMSDPDPAKRLTITDVQNQLGNLITELSSNYQNSPSIIDAVKNNPMPILAYSVPLLSGLAIAGGIALLATGIFAPIGIAAIAAGSIGFLADLSWISRRNLQHTAYLKELAQYTDKDIQKSTDVTIDSLQVSYAKINKMAGGILAVETLAAHDTAKKPASSKQYTKVIQPAVTPTTQESPNQNLSDNKDTPQLS